MAPYSIEINFERKELVLHYHDAPDKVLARHDLYRAAEVTIPDPVIEHELARKIAKEKIDTEKLSAVARTKMRNQIASDFEHVKRSAIADAAIDKVLGLFDRKIIDEIEGV